jgi:hypothetical protein
MNNRNTGMIATIVSALVCGCCALFTCIFGFGTITGNGSVTFNSSIEQLPPTYGYVFLCLSVLMILVPVAVGVFTLRKRPDSDGAVPSDQTVQ